MPNIVTWRFLHDISSISGRWLSFSPCDIKMHLNPAVTDGYVCGMAISSGQTISELAGLNYGRVLSLVFTEGVRQRSSWHILVPN